MSHQDDILEIMKTALDRGWHDTNEIHAAVGTYWHDQRIHVAENKTQQYTHHALLRLYQRGIIERMRLEGVKNTYWRVRQ